jgi:catechol 2,3-dioxygenase-like lactoylglutathione lyase family enzyme
MRARIDEIVFDCHDPARLVRFWAALLGGEPVDRSADWSYVDPPEFARVQVQMEPVLRRLALGHQLERHAGDVDAAADEAVRLGAERVGAVVADDHGRFQVLRDPEGNEFCFVAGEDG